MLLHKYWKQLGTGRLQHCAMKYNTIFFVVFTWFPNYDLKAQGTHHSQKNAFPTREVGPSGEHVNAASALAEVFD